MAFCFAQHQHSTCVSGSARVRDRAGQWQCQCSASGSQWQWQCQWQCQCRWQWHWQCQWYAYFCTAAQIVVNDTTCVDNRQLYSSTRQCKSNGITDAHVWWEFGDITVYLFITVLLSTILTDHTLAVSVNQILTGRFAEWSRLGIYSLWLTA